MAKKTGIILIKVNGKTLEAMPGVKFNYGNNTRTEVIANGGVTGFFETPTASMVSCTIPHDQNTNLEEIMSWAAVTLVIKPDAGPSYQIDNAFQTNALELADAGGGFAVEFKGPRAEKL